MEAERRARMAKMRQDNDDEVKKLSAPIDDKAEARKLEPTKEIIQVNEEDLEGMEEEEQMKMMLGFSGGFGSTAGQQVEDNDNSAAKGAAAKNKARKYRQYMNRKSGFNRPLEKMD